MDPNRSEIAQEAREAAIWARDRRRRRHSVSQALGLNWDWPGQSARGAPMHGRAVPERQNLV